MNIEVHKYIIQKAMSKASHEDFMTASNSLNALVAELAKRIQEEEKKDEKS